MPKFFHKYKKTKTGNNYTEQKVKEYLYKYLKELQRHFDMPDNKMRMILYRIYKDTGGFNRFIKFMKKKLSRVKIQIYKNKGK